MMAEAANDRIHPSMGDHHSEPSMEGEVTDQEHVEQSDNDPLREEEEVYEDDG